MVASRLFLVLLSFLTQIAAALPLDYRGLYAHEVEVNEMSDGGFRLSFSVPCGSVFFGIIAQEKVVRGQTILELGAVFQERSLACARGEEPVSIATKLFDKDRYVRIRGMELANPVQLSMARTYDIGVEKGQVYGVVEKKCSPVMGVLLRLQGGIRRLDNDVLEIGVAHQSGRNSVKGVACEPSPRIQRILKLNDLRNVTIKPIGEKLSILRKMFYLKMEPILSLQEDKVFFKKNCNEVPVGVAEPIGEKGRLRVVLASFPNFRCIVTERKVSISSYPVNMFSQARQKSWKFDTVDEGGRWELKVLGQKEAKEKKGKIFEYLDRCKRKASPSGRGILWSVWSWDSKGRVALGVLVPQQDGEHKNCEISRKKLADSDLEYDLSTLRSLRLRVI